MSQPYTFIISKHFYYRYVKIFHICTTTFVILNSELPCELCEGSFLRSKIHLRKNEGCSHQRHGESYAKAFDPATVNNFQVKSFCVASKNLVLATERSGVVFLKSDKSRPPRP